MRVVTVWFSIYSGSLGVLIPTDSVFLSATGHDENMCKLHYLTGEPAIGEKTQMENHQFILCNEDVNLPFLMTGGVKFLATVTTPRAGMSPVVTHIFEELP